MQNSAKVVLITGAARRIGAAIARHLHESGMNVALHYYTSKNEAEQLSSDLNSLRKNSAITLSYDLDEIYQFPQLVEEVIQHWGRLDGLVNNAARFYKTELSQVSENGWDDLLTINLKVPYFLAQAAIPYLKTHEGSIVNIADIHADRPMRDYSAYCISKAGLVMLTKSLAKELGPEIRVNAISPGPIVWPEESNALTDEMKSHLINKTVLKREGNADEIGKAVLFLMRDAKYITGQVIAVDGGRMLNL